MVAIGTEGSLLLQDTTKNSIGESLGLAEELQMRTKGGGRVDEVGFGEFGGQFLAQLRRVLLDTERGDLNDMETRSV